MNTNTTSNITKTIGGQYEIDATGGILAPGNRIAAGTGDDYDTGTIDEIDGNTATVRWDSLVVTTLPLDEHSVRVLI